MEKNSFLYRCSKSGINPVSVSNKPKSFVLVHVFLETGYRSIIGFSDSYSELANIRDSHPHFGNSRHEFVIAQNLLFDSIMKPLKDECLINICNNVAEYLAVGEYAMLKKSYFIASSWFEKAKNSASLGSEIIDNY